MSTAAQIIPQLEGIVSTVPSNAQQTAMLWVDMCKQIMRQPDLRDKTDWAFEVSDDPDATANDVEDGAVLYAALIDQASADASQDTVVFTNDADGTLTVAHTDTCVVPTLAYKLPAAGTDGTSEFWPLLFPKGIAFANHMCFGAEGEDGTDADTGDLRGYLLFRESTS